MLGQPLNQNLEVLGLFSAVEQEDQLQPLPTMIADKKRKGKALVVSATPRNAKKRSATRKKGHAGGRHSCVKENVCLAHEEPIHNRFEESEFADPIVRQRAHVEPSPFSPRETRGMRKARQAEQDIHDTLQQLDYERQVYETSSQVQQTKLVILNIDHML